MTEPLGEVPATTSFLDSLGARSTRRAEPRASIALAGAGCALAVLGTLVVAGDAGAADGDFNRVPGLILSAMVVAAGLVTLTMVRSGPIATAGTVAAALGVPPLMFFATLDLDGVPPYNTNVILIVSSAAWLAAYAVGPGRGRPFFLGAGLIGLWLTVLQVVEDVFDAPFGLMGFGSGSESFSSTGTEIGPDGAFDDSGFDSSELDMAPFETGPSFDVPDPTVLGLLCLVVGVGYLLTARWLDGRAHHGIATPFQAAALLPLLLAPFLMADDLETAGTGLLLVLIGAALAVHGAGVARRLTTWLGGGTVALGAAVFISDMSDDATVGGMLLMAAGIALVAIGHVTAVALSEPDEMAVTVGQPAGATAIGDDATGPTPPPIGGEHPTDDADWGPPPEPPMPGSAPPEP